MAIQFGSFIKTMTGLATRGVGLGRQLEPLQPPPPALPPLTVDRVEAWFDDMQFSPAAAAIIEEAVRLEGAPGHASPEKALANVDELLEAFKRLDSQLETILDSLQTYNPRP